MKLVVTKRDIYFTTSLILLIFVIDYVELSSATATKIVKILLWLVFMFYWNKRYRSADAPPNSRD